MASALTFEATRIISSIKTPVRVKNALSAAVVDTRGLWDTGAQNSAITDSVAKLLGLPVIQKANVRGVHGIKEVNVYYVEIILNNPNITVKCLATGCDELSDDGPVGLLLGMNIISQGDFTISNFGGRTTMSFRVPSLERKDYVAEVNEYNRYLKIHNSWMSHGDSRCPCGSGKQWKNCHGKSIYR